MTERREGHKALRARDGKLETYDPHPGVESALKEWLACIAKLPVLSPTADEGFKAGWNCAIRSVLAARPEERAPDPGTEKLLRTLLDRAYKMMLQSGYKVAVVDSDNNDPIVAWMSDARHVLYGSGRVPNLTLDLQSAPSSPPLPQVEKYCDDCAQTYNCIRADCCIKRRDMNGDRQ